MVNWVINIDIDNDNGGAVRVFADNVSGDDEAIEIDNDSDGLFVSVTITGDVTAGNQEGIDIDNQGVGGITVTATNADNSSQITALNIEGVLVVNDNGGAVVVAVDNVYAYEYGIDIDNDTAGSTVTVTGTGNIIAETDDAIDINSEGTGEATTLAYAFTAGSNTVNFGQSLPTANFANADWVPNGTKVVDGDGWMTADSYVRWDTDEEDAATQAAVVAGIVTMVVDLRESVSNPGSNLSASMRLRNVTDGPNATPGYDIGTASVNQSSTDSAGVIDLNSDGSVWRFWAKITVTTPGARLIVELPRQAEPNVDYRNPAVFMADLSEAEIAAL